MSILTVYRETTRFPLFAVFSLITVFPKVTTSWAAEQTVLLTPGWNLAAFQVQPQNSSVVSVFAPVMAACNLNWEVWTYDAEAFPPKWVGYQAKTGGVRTLSRVNAGRGYWVYLNPGVAKNDVSISAQGATMTGSLSLHAGWNLIGSFSQTPLRVATVMTTELLNAGASLADWVPGGQTTSSPIAMEPAYLPPTEDAPIGLFAVPSILLPGQGYYIYVAQDVLWGGPVLKVDSLPMLTFGQGVDTYTVKIQNPGTQGYDLEWSATSTTPWLSIIDGLGRKTASGGTDSFAVAVDWNVLGLDKTQMTGKSLKADINITSNGGFWTLPVEFVLRGVEGFYLGYAKPSKVNGQDMILPNVKLAINILPGVQSAILAHERTPFFPRGVYFRGVQSDGETILNTSFSMEPNEALVSWMFGGQIIRTVRLHGAWPSNDQFVGTAVGDYAETVECKGAAPVEIRGTFELRRQAALDPQADASGLKIGATGRPDKDADGMPDDWEIVYGMDIRDPTDGQEDHDGDTLSNLAEYWNRSDPLDSNDGAIPIGSKMCISGSITDSQGVPVSGVPISAYFGGDVITTTSDPAGKYHFDDPVPGYYILVFGPSLGWQFSPTYQGLRVLRNSPVIFDIQAAGAARTGTDTAACTVAGPPSDGQYTFCPSHVPMQQTESPYIIWPQ